MGHGCRNRDTRFLATDSFPIAVNLPASARSCRICTIFLLLTRIMCPTGTEYQVDTMETSPDKCNGAGVSPQPILEAAWSFAATRVLTTVTERDVFTSIARGQTTLEDLDARIRMLLNALVALKYVEARAGRYNLPRVSAAYLTKKQSALHRRLPAAQQRRALVFLGTPN